MSNLSDSDDSDDDFLFQERAFAKPEPAKQEKTPLNILNRMASGKSIELKGIPQQQSTGRKRLQKRSRKPSNNKQPKKKVAKPSKSEVLRAQRRKDPEWIERQARKTVDEVLGLDVVDKITDLNDIGWSRYTTKKGKQIDYYPAIISRNKAEAKTLLKNSGKKKFKTIKIQYIGVDWGDSLKHQEIALTNWIPYSKSSDSKNEELLQSFVKTISKTKRFKNNPLELKIEEFAVRKMWEKVKAQKEQRQLEQEKDREDALQSALNFDTLGPPIPTETVTQDSDNNSRSQYNEEVDDADSDDSSSSFSSDDESLASPGVRRTKRKRTALHVNDEIEYYDIMGAFGNPSFLRRARIVGITLNESFPLQLEDTIMPIPGTHRVRRLPDGFWQPINEFVLLQEGVQSLTGKGSGLDKAKNKMRKIQSEISQARDRFWKGADKKDKNTEDQDDNAKDNSDVCLRRSRRSSVRSRRKSK